MIVEGFSFEISYLLSLGGIAADEREFKEGGGTFVGNADILREDRRLFGLWNGSEGLKICRSGLEAVRTRFIIKIFNTLRGGVCFSFCF